MICLTDLLKTPDLADLTVIAGHQGLSRQINTVTLLDAPDGPKWLKGGEFVLTSAYIFDNDYRLLEEYVRALIENHASGLGIKKGRFMDLIPEKILKMADDHEFPMVQIPYRYVWTDIIAPFYRLKHDPHNRVKPISIEPDMILPIFEASKWGAKRLLPQLTDLLGLPAVIYKQDKSRLLSNEINGVDQIELAVAGLKALPERKHQRPVRVDDFFCSFYCLPRSYHGLKEYLAVASVIEEDLVELDKLMALLENLSGNDITAPREKSGLYKNFIYKIVIGEITVDEITLFEQNRIRKPEEKIYTGILILSSEYYSEIDKRLKEALQTYCKHQKLRVETYLFDNSAQKQAVVLLEITSGRQLECGPLIRGLIPLMNSLTPGSKEAYISFSSLSDSLQRILQQYEEAQEALKLGGILWPEQRCHYYPDYTIYSLLNQGSLSQAHFESMKLLLDSRSTASFNASQTAEAYIECGNYKKAAAKLYIHENTLRYRINKISELLNIDIENPLEGYRFLTLIKLWKLYCCQVERSGRK